MVLRQTPAVLDRLGIAPLQPVPQEVLNRIGDCDVGLFRAKALLVRAKDRFELGESGSLGPSTATLDDPASVRVVADDF